MGIKEQVMPEELREIARSYEMLENGNWRFESVLLLAQTLGTSEDVTKAEELLKYRNSLQSGFRIDDPKLEERKQLHERLYSLFKQMLEENGIKLEDIELGADPETGGNAVGVWLPEQYTEIGKPVHDWLKETLGDKYLL